MTDRSYTFNAHDNMPGGRRQEICDWLASVGADPKAVVSGEVYSVGIGEWELHVHEHVLTPSGVPQLDGDRRSPVRRPRTVALTAEDVRRLPSGGTS